MRRGGRFCDRSGAGLPHASRRRASGGVGRARRARRGPQRQKKTTRVRGPGSKSVAEGGRRGERYGGSRDAPKRTPRLSRRTDPFGPGKKTAARGNFGGGREDPRAAGRSRRALSNARARLAPPVFLYSTPRAKLISRIINHLDGWDLQKCNVDKLFIWPSGQRVFRETGAGRAWIALSRRVSEIVSREVSGAEGRGCRK